MLTGSMFFYVFFLIDFRLLVGCEGVWPLWVVLIPSWGLRRVALARAGTRSGKRIRTEIGPSLSGLGPLLGPLLAVLGRREAFAGSPGALVQDLGSPWGLGSGSWPALGPWFRILARPWGLGSGSWPVLGPWFRILARGNAIWTGDQGRAVEG